jgi:hypothetical protein
MKFKQGCLLKAASSMVLYLKMMRVNKEATASLAYAEDQNSLRRFTILKVCLLTRQILYPALISPNSTIRYLLNVAGSLTISHRST